MNKEDLETYQVQLQQVEAALASDPDNDGLKDLHKELKELISLTEQALAHQATATSSSLSGPSKKTNAQSTSAPLWKAGDECLAKYSSDAQWYPARIASVGGSAENRAYTIVFKTYNTTELVSSSAIKPLPANHQAVNNPYLSSTSNKRKPTKVEEEERERKRKKNEKKLEVRAQKAKEQNEKQATWQKFAKKSEKKGVHIAGVAGTSIFKTPDNPLGKGVFSHRHREFFVTPLTNLFQVGVTGSGKGMTAVAAPQKHKFVADEDESPNLQCVTAVLLAYFSVNELIDAR